MNAKPGLIPIVLAPVVAPIAHAAGTGQFGVMADGNSRRLFHIGVIDSGKPHA